MSLLNEKHNFPNTILFTSGKQVKARRTLSTTNLALTEGWILQTHSIVLIDFFLNFLADITLEVAVFIDYVMVHDAREVVVGILFFL